MRDICIKQMVESWFTIMVSSSFGSYSYALEYI